MELKVMLKEHCDPGDERGGRRLNDDRIETTDKEWVTLILEAKRLGLTKAEVEV
ncbi:DNA-binding anti-repressor SinI [Pseudalkalibacillus sp. R45]|uniref:DNA-binding anti-repressor SinI n=1 Tax=Pseudalkalibacillus sp. R45 TaxID=3457433 RepID=UPI003FCDC66B